MWLNLSRFLPTRILGHVLLTGSQSLDQKASLREENDPLALHRLVEARQVIAQRQQGRVTVALTLETCPYVSDKW